MAATKKSNTKSGRPKKQNTSRASEPENSFIRVEVILIASFAFSVLLLLSNFHLCGLAGDFLRSVQLGIFGIFGYIAPFLLFIGTCFYLSNRGNYIANLKLFSVILSILCLCGLAQLLFGNAYDKGQGLSQFYKASSVNGLGGGWLGGVLSTLLSSVVGRIGAYLVFLAALVICVVCITEKSVVAVVKRGGGRAYQYAKEDMDRRKVIHQQRQEEKRRLREEQKVRGVNLDSTNLIQPPAPQTPPAYLDNLDDFDQLLEHVAPPDHAAATAAMPVERAEEVSQEAFQADVFTGQIMGAGRKAEDMAEDDTIPFDADSPLEGQNTGMTKTKEVLPVRPSEDIFVRKEARAVKTPWTQAEMNIIEDEDFQDYGFRNSGYQEDFKNSDRMDGDCQALNQESIQSQAGEKEWEKSLVSEEMDYTDRLQPDIAADSSFHSDSFTIAEEPKKVVTASGKIIETETEALQKKLEANRAKSQEQNQEQAKAQPGSGSIPAQPEPKHSHLPVVKKEYQFPSLSLLTRGSKTSIFSEREYKETAIKLQQTLKNFGVGVTVTNISCGPSVTRYELQPEQGVKVSRIVGLSDDIKLNLAAADIRIEAPIPGKAAVGIEVPNKENNVVLLRDLLEAKEFKEHPSSLAFAVGKDIGGQVVVADIGKMPHLLIAGATGSGKSVCINTLIMSIIYKADPEDVKMIMVDPKVVELSVYNGIPHLLIPVVTDPKKASGALNWAVAEMMERYDTFAKYNVRDLKGYNAKVAGIRDMEEEDRPKKLPQIVIIVDELADLMMVAPGEVEDAICRLAQLARAAGIHLVIATQRPSVNVITGLIKANVPSRIAFSVSSGVDSRTIIDMNGAEKLLGKGDMLFYPSGYQKPQRVQGAFVSDQEVSRVVEFLTQQEMVTEYQPDIESRMAAMPMAESKDSGSDRDEYFIQAGKFIIEKDKASIGMLQRMFKIGFNRAARIMDQLAEAGVVGEEEGTKPRKVLMTQEEFEQING